MLDIEEREETNLFTCRYDGFGLSGNGVSSDLIRPQFQGVKDNEITNYRAASSSLSDYGGGALGSSSSQVQSARQTGIETLLNTFLGSTLLLLFSL